MHRPTVGGDAVAARRAQMDRLANLGRRIGYGLFGVAVAAFAAGAAGGFSTPVVVVVIGCLAVGSVILAPAIVVGYGVRAAERDEREESARRGGGATN